jgi:hypothetical protein
VDGFIMIDDFDFQTDFHCGWLLVLLLPIRGRSQAGFMLPPVLKNMLLGAQ